MFEVKIAKIAAQRATPEDIKLIEMVLNKMNQKEELKDEKKTESDTEFHLAIAKASHNFVFVK